MYADMLKNTKMLSVHSFGAIMNDVNALAAIVQGGQALAYSLGNLDQLFRQTYPGYGYNAGTYYTQYRNWSQTSLDTTLGTCLLYTSSITTTLTTACCDLSGAASAVSIIPLRSRKYRATSMKSSLARTSMAEWNPASGGNTSE